MLGAHRGCDTIMVRHMRYGTRRLGKATPRCSFADVPEQPPLTTCRLSTLQPQRICSPSDLQPQRCASSVHHPPSAWCTGCCVGPSTTMQIGRSRGHSSFFCFSKGIKEVERAAPGRCWAVGGLLKLIRSAAALLP